MPAKAPKIEIPDAAQRDDLQRDDLQRDDFLATVTCAHSRRRAGHAFGPSPVHLTRAQLATELADARTVAAAIEDDPLLVIRPYKPQAQAEPEAPKE